MTLHTKSHLKSHRTHLNKLLYNRKLQLANAYASKTPKHIRTAKIALIRILLELHGSPELGPPLPFKPGWRLEMLLTHGVDSKIESLPKSWFAAADILATSLYPSEPIEGDPVEAALQSVEQAMEETGWELK